MKCPTCGRTNLVPIAGSGFRLRCLLCQDLCTTEEATYVESIDDDDDDDDEAFGELFDSIVEKREEEV
jgi:hypothetical protein